MIELKWIHADRRNRKKIFDPDTDHTDGSALQNNPQNRPFTRLQISRGPLLIF